MTISPLNIRPCSYPLAMLLLMALVTFGCSQSPPIGRASDTELIVTPVLSVNVHIRKPPSRHSTVELHLKGQRFVYDLKSQTGRISTVSTDSLANARNKSRLTMDELVRGARQLHPAPMKVLRAKNRLVAVATNGVFYWDASQDSLLHYQRNPVKKISSVEAIGEDGLYLNETVVLNLSTGGWSLQLPGEQERGAVRFNSDQQVALYYCQHPYGNGNRRVFIPGNHGLVATEFDRMQGQIHIAPPYIWQLTNQHFKVYDLRSESSRKYSCFIPGNGGSPYVSMNVFYADSMVWVPTVNSLYVFDISSGQRYFQRYSSPQVPRVIRVDDQSVILKSAEGTERLSAVEYLKSCPVFDEQQYLADLQHYRHTLDSLAITKETTDAGVLRKLTALETRFGNSEMPEIKGSMNGLRRQAFRGVALKTDADYYRSIENDSLPIERRQVCLRAILRKHWRNAETGSIIECYDRYRKVQELDSELHWESWEILQTYLATVDSLDQLTATAPDTVAYHRVMAMQGYSTASPMLGEGCSGPYYKLLIDSLNWFQLKFPKSQLADNAYFQSMTPGWDLLNWDIEDIKTSYQKCRDRYPHTDIGPDFEFIMINFELFNEPGSQSSRKQKLESFLAQDLPPRIRNKAEALLENIW